MPEHSLTSNLTSIAVLLLGLCSQSLAAGDAPDIEVDYHALGAAYAILVSFAAEPEIAAARYSIDGEDSIDGDSTLKTTKLPLYKEFSSQGRNWTWYLQGSVYYSSLEQTTDFQLDVPLEGSSDLEWTGYGGLIEAGLIFPLSHGFSWTAGLGTGISRLESDAEFSNEKLEDTFAPVLDGTVYNWETNATNLRGNLGLLYDKEHGNYRLKGSSHFTYSHIESFGESSRFSGFSDHASTLTVKLDVRHPLNIELRKHPVYIIGHLGNTQFIGSNRNELGFSSFSELGLSFGVEKVTLGLLGIIGNDVSGWNLILNYDY